MLNEVTITKAIVERFFQKLSDHLELDVAIVGGGPSGLVAGYYLGKAGVKVALFEKNLSIGGGVWGGGMMFNEVVVQDAGKLPLDEMGISVEPYSPGYHTVDSVKLASALTYKAMEAGLKIFNLVAVEDVVMTSERVAGLVLNWGAVRKLEWPIDPLTVSATHVVDATGHHSSVVAVMARKMGVELDTPNRGVVGEKSLLADLAELQTLENTREVYPGLHVCGMAANAVHGGYRMGPVFGGMLLSGKKVAENIIAQLRGRVG